ncbi:MAG: hypothetical protein WC943_13575, partial [Elusimicrobiota bacterium]
MTGLVLVLCFFSSPAMAELPKLTIRQEAEIITLIEQASHELDGSKDRQVFRNPVYGPALETKIKREKAMGLRNDKGELVDPNRTEPTEEQLDKISRGLRFWEPDRRKEYQDAVWKIEAAKKKSRDRYQEALELTRKYARIGPKGEDGFPVNGPPWDRKKWLAWSPTVSTVPEPWAEGSEQDVRNNFDRQPSFLRGSDAAVIFRPSAFFDNLTGRPHPGKVARLLRHEAMHVVDFRTPEDQRDLRNMPAREVTFRLAELYFGVESYSISPEGWKGLLMDAMGYSEMARQWEAYIAAGYSPYNKSQNKEKFAKLGISSERKKQIEADVEHDVKLFSDAGRELGGEGRIESLEHLREQAQSSFLKGLGAPELMTLIKSWNKARELEAGKQQKEVDIVFARAEIEAERCGFRHLRKDDGLPGSRNGFHLEDPSYPGKTYAGVRYYYRYDTGLDRIKMAVLLARACYDGQYGEQYEPKEPCNDSLDIINRRWGDPEFQKHLELDVEGGAGMGQRECLLYMRDHLQVPADWKGLTAHVRQAWKSYREGRRGGSTRPQEPSRGNPGGGGSGRDGNGGGIDPKPSLPRDPDWDGWKPH